MTTSTDLAVQQQGAAPSFVQATPEQITQALTAWVGGMEASVRGAEYIVDTPMCPDSFWPLPPGVNSKTPKQLLPKESIEDYRDRRRVAACTLGSVVRYGLQLGLPPEVSAQGIFPIGGRMSMYAEQMVALVKAHGHGHRVVERTAQRCVIEVRRRGTDRWIPFEFTIEQAVQAGYVPDAGPNAGDHGRWPDGKPKKSPGNPKYLTDPATMLYARASSIGCKTEFPDVLRGLVTYEEMQDEQRSEPVDITASVEVTTPEPAGRPTKAAILAAAGRRDETPADTPPAPDPTPAAPAPEVERAVLPSTDAQLRMLGAVMAQLGVEGAGSKARRLTIATRIVDRPLGAATDLTQDEAKLVVDTLTSVLNDPQRAQLLHQLEHGDPATDSAEDTAVLAELLDDPNSQWNEMDGGEAAGEELLG